MENEKSAPYIGFSPKSYIQENLKILYEGKINEKTKENLSKGFKTLKIFRLRRAKLKI